MASLRRAGAWPPDLRATARPAGSGSRPRRGVQGRRHPAVGVPAFEGFEPNDLVLYVERRRAVLVGDTLIDRGNGLELNRDWPGEGVSAEQVIGTLPEGAALERALS